MPNAKNIAVLNRIIKQGYTEAQAKKILKKLIAKKKKGKPSKKKKSRKSTKKKATRKPTQPAEDPTRVFLREQIERAAVDQKVNQANELARALSESKVAKEEVERKQQALEDAARIARELKSQAGVYEREARESADRYTNLERQAARKQQEIKDAQDVTADILRLGELERKKVFRKLIRSAATTKFVLNEDKQNIKEEWTDWIAEQQAEGNIPKKGTIDIDGVGEISISKLKALSNKNILKVAKAYTIKPVLDIYHEIKRELKEQLNESDSEREPQAKESKRGHPVTYAPPSASGEAEVDNSGLGLEPNAKDGSEPKEGGAIYRKGNPSPSTPQLQNSLYHEIFGSGRPDVLSNYQLDFLMKKHPEYAGTISRDEVKNLRSPPGNIVCWIMNTDPSNMPGKHWVAVYIDPVNDMSAEYYNSSGEGCPDDIFQDISKAVDKISPQVKLRFKDNRIKNQDDSDNCGWFCMYFLKQRLAGKPWTFCTGYTQLTEDLIEKWKNKMDIPQSFKDI